ncbi:hypothetical protein GGX14DRAFT_578063 [Mycena pura]|uniref:Uncharacterized protein n=1 Tax=Mycena pura TaxID=153505 RepID=A0AAD6Y1P0_9AGAR|nr:hypothetical protein GGX14DRAFT_578063 [Mycena pura]
MSKISCLRAALAVNYVFNMHPGDRFTSGLDCPHVRSTYGLRMGFTSLRLLATVAHAAHGYILCWAAEDKGELAVIDADTAQAIQYRESKINVMDIEEDDGVDDWNFL